MSVYPGIVYDTDDPKKAHRVRALVPSLFLDTTTGEPVPSPWIEGEGSLGDGAGITNVPPVGTPIKVHAEAGTDAGIWVMHYTLGRVGREGSRSHAPPTAQGLDGEAETVLKDGVPITVPSRGTVTIASQGASLELGTETIDGLPGTMNDGAYPHVRSFRTPGGIIVELDDTPERARVQAWHPSGSYLELGDGGVVASQAATSHRRVLARNLLHVGEEVLAVDGDHRTSVGGDRLATVAGKDLARVGEYAREVEGPAVLSAKGTIDLNGRGGVRIRTAGDRVETVAGQARATFVGPYTSLTLSSSKHVHAAGLNHVMLGLPAVFTAPQGVPQPVAKAPAVVIHATVLAGLLTQMKAAAAAMSTSGVASLIAAAAPIEAAVTALEAELVAASDVAATSLWGS